MEERRLNLNTPLLSVRRNLSSASMNATSSQKGRTVDNSRPRNQQKILASKNVDRSMDQVTEPVSVPFTWEQVPGKAKDDGEPELLPSEETVPAIPMIAARNSSSISDVCPEKEFREKSQMEKGSVTDDDEMYSDAVDTLSLTDSSSVSYSVSSLGESDGTVMKPSGTSSVDTQTRDFMMGRFLSAARAMAIASESSLHHASRKQHLLLTEQPKEVEKPQVLAIESGTPSRQHNMEIVKYCTQALCQTESSEEEEEEGGDDRSEYGPVPGKGCGLLPQLCLRSSLWLLNPIPGLKSKVKNSMPFVPAIRKDLKVESISQSIFKSGGPQTKSEQQVKTPESEVGQIKPLGGSNRRNFSGEFQRVGRLSPFRSTRTDVAISEKRESPQPAYALPPLGGSRRLNLSGELRPTRQLSPFRSLRNDVAISGKNESPRPPHVVPSLGGSSRLYFSGELRTTSGLSSFRPSRNNNVSSEKSELPRSSYIVPPLGRVSQRNFSGELRTTSRLSPFRPSRNDVVTTETKESSQLSYMAPPLGESSRHNFSGQLHTTGRLSTYRPPRNDVANLEKNLSPRASYVMPSLGGVNRHNFSSELRTAGRLSPFRPSRDDVMVSKKNESSQPSYVVQPLGWSGRHSFSGELQTQRRQSLLRTPRSHSMTLQKNESNSLLRQGDEKKYVSTLNKANGCIRPVSPAFERTLYVDKVHTGWSSCSDINLLDREVWMDPVAEEMATREVEETSNRESSFQDIECLNDVSRNQTSKEVNDGVFEPSSLPLPSLKSPSESWLWHTLPSLSDRSPFSSLQKTAPLSSKKHDSDTPMLDAKWETIVKTSKTLHDHTRYSEELIEHVPQQYKS